MSVRFMSRAAGCAVVALLAGCGAQPQAPQKTSAPGFAPGMVSDTPSANESQLQNDPSAPLNTPLCGTAAREAQSMGVQNYPQPLAVGNSCTQNACFNTQTGTYIAADGSARVCR